MNAHFCIVFILFYVLLIDFHVNVQGMKSLQLRYTTNLHRCSAFHRHRQKLPAILLRGLNTILFDRINWRLLAISPPESILRAWLNKLWWHALLLVNMRARWYPDQPTPLRWYRSTDGPTSCITQPTISCQLSVDSCHEDCIFALACI